MKEQFVTYEIALKLKELCFNERCFGYYFEAGNQYLLAIEENVNPVGGIRAPLWQQAEQWFRDTHNYYATVYRLNNKWCGDVYDMLRQRYITYNALNNVLYDTYEEAREQAILKAIELCQKER